MAGDVGFDPLGLSEINGVGIDLYWLREAEIKHCRVAMMAAVGNVWVEAFGPAPGCEAATAKNQMDAFWQIWKAHPQYIVGALIFLDETFSIVQALAFGVLLFAVYKITLEKSYR